MDDCEIIVSKEPAARPAKDGGDGLNARQRRKGKKRAKALASTQHLDFARKALIKKRTKQANRWLDYQNRTGQIPGLQNELRWGLKTGKPWLLADDAQSVFDRLELERSAALGRLNKERKAANPGAEDEAWVEDWFGEANVGTSTTGVGTGNTSVSLAIRTAPAVKKEEERTEMEVEEDNGEKGRESTDRGEALGDPEYMSDVAMDGNGL